MTFYQAYRAQTFSEVIGQDIITTILQQTLLRDRLAHAYLFSGPRGTGKTSTARIFARAIVCLNPKKTESSFEPCNTCESCVSLLENRSPDILEIDAASNRRIDDIRDLREQVQYHPIALKKKIYIIDEVHMLTPEAFNALLKTLEEPPSYCLFILATTEPQKIPATIRSRCQFLRFERGSVLSIEQKLQTIVSKENISIDPKALTLIAQHSNGGFRDAETLLESVSSGTKEISLLDLERTLGALPKEELSNLLQACLSGDQALTSELTQKSIQTLQENIEHLTTQLIEQLRVELYKNPSQSTQMTYALEQLLEAYILQKGSPIPSLPLEIALMNICSQNISQPHVSEKKVAPIKTEIAEIKQVIQITPPVTPPLTAEVPVIELRTEEVSDIRKAWKEMIAQIIKENLVLGQSLKQAIFHAADNSVITIYVRYTFHADKMNEKRNRVRVSEILTSLSGQEWTVEYVVNNTLPRKNPLKAVGAGIEDAKAIFN